MTGDRPCKAETPSLTKPLRDYSNDFTMCRQVRAGEEKSGSYAGSKTFPAPAPCETNMLPIMTG